MKIALLFVALQLCVVRNGAVSAFREDEDVDVPRRRSSNYHLQEERKPDIVIIVADDLGWNDVSFHGSEQIPTPNIDALAYNGVILNSHYVTPLCTPSRAALMTGKYPIRLGMQYGVIFPSEPRGLPLGEKLLPEYLREAGYATYAVGKWHLGYYKNVYTPTYRGFDSFFGYYNGLQDYYTHFTQEMSEKLKNFNGFDMRRNLSVAWDTYGEYATDLFSRESVRLIEQHDKSRPMFLYLAHLAPHSGNSRDLLQAPDEEIAKFAHIHEPERRMYAAMVSKLDQSVGEVVAALRNRGMLQNSIVLFISDNGAPTRGFLSNWGSNYPLRGMKESPWEGGVRGVAAVWSPLIEKPKRVSNQLMHITDWLPTLFSAAGLDKRLLSNIDGVDLWQSIVSNSTSPRSEALLNIDDISNYSAIRRGEYKYIIGNSGTENGWIGESGRSSEQFGFPPAYDPEKVLQSKAGVAIAAVVTTKQMKLKERRKSIRKDQVDEELRTRMLTVKELLELRKEAEVKCEAEEKEMVPCDPILAPCLFNVVKDPCEMVNLAELRPVVVAQLEQALLKHRFNMIPAANVDMDELANPLLYNNTWTNWADNETLFRVKEIRETANYVSETAVVMIAVFLVLAIVGIIVLAFKFGRNCQSREVTNRYECKEDPATDNNGPTLKNLMNNVN